MAEELKIFLHEVTSRAPGLGPPVPDNSVRRYDKDTKISEVLGRLDDLTIGK